MRNDYPFMEVIWNQLDQYKEAVVGGKNQDELKMLENKLLKELTELPGYNDQEIAIYFLTQCRNIEARYSIMGHPISN